MKAGTSKFTGDAILDAVINRINKDFSRAVVSTRPTVKNIPAIPSGSLGLDFAIGIGGLPRGRIIEIYGQEGSGKTSWALYWARKFQEVDPDRYVLIVDAEHSMTEDFITGFGINEERMIYVSPDGIAESLDPLYDMVKTGRIGFVVFDSIGSLQPESETEKSVASSNMGGIAKTLHNFFRKYSKLTADCTSVFINQLTFNPGAGGFGNPETTPGGTALKFYASLRVRAGKAKPSKTTPGAFSSKLKIVKSKAGPPVGHDILTDFIYARGPDPLLDTLNTGKDLGVLRFAGSALKIQKEPGIEAETLCTGGVAGFFELCIEQPETLTMIRDLCMAARKNVVPAEPEEEEDEDAELPEADDE